MRDLVNSLYGDELGESVFERLSEVLSSFVIKCPTSRRPTETSDRFSDDVSERDAILITYADSFSSSSFSDKEAPFRTLARFLDTSVGKTLNSVHILPFFPWTSDYGFSVKDYHSVHSDWGTWEDVHEIGKNYSLMFDLVINHMSAEGEWFQGYLKGDPKYDGFFISVDPSLDYSKVTRPRALPLLTKYETARGSEWIWTTFSADQIDLNFSNPQVLLAMLEILLEYVGHGARFIRLDAIGFLWKEMGTTCMHLPQTHAVVQLMRSVLNQVAPHVQLITETNVPHLDNISYFGNGHNEAQSVYNFPLPPLTAHAIIRQDSSYLTKWASALELPSKEVRFFNFLASHDGIGVNPVRGILAEEEISFLCKCVEDRQGKISYRNNGDGTRSPYELNCTYCDFLTPLDDSDELRIKRHILAHSIMLSMPGIPGIYVHSLIGSRNYLKGIEETGSFRAINREQLDCDTIIKQLECPESFRSQIFSRMRRMLEVRTSTASFSPSAEFLIHDVSNKLFVIERGSRAEGTTVLAIHNLSSDELRLTLPDQLIAESDLLGSTKLNSNSVVIEPLGIFWCSCR